MKETKLSIDAGNISTVLPIPIIGQVFTIYNTSSSEPLTIYGQSAVGSYREYIGVLLPNESGNYKIKRRSFWEWLTGRPKYYWARTKGRTGGEK